MAVVGTIARAHGNRGQVIVNPATDFLEDRFHSGAELFARRTGAVETMTLTSVRFHKGRPIVGIAGVDTMTAAEGLAGVELRIPIDRLSPLPADTFYYHDLVGCAVETRTGDVVGTVTGVEGEPGGYRLVVAGAHGEVLIPLAAAICTTIDIPGRKIVVDPPEGLLDLNQ
jgi:16S rRNA processing protein RimM